MNVGYTWFMMDVYWRNKTEVKIVYQRKEGLSLSMATIMVMLFLVRISTWIQRVQRRESTE